MRLHSLTIAVLLLAAPLCAEDSKYFPLDHRKPVGEGGALDGDDAAGDQPLCPAVQIQLPTEGEVSFYRGGATESVTLPAPAQAGMQVVTPTG